MELESNEMVESGFCSIENRKTPHKKLQNGLWVCISGGCSGCSGQSKELKQIPTEEHLPNKKWYLGDVRVK